MRQRRTTKDALLPGRGPLARVPAAAAFLVVAALFAVGVVVGGVLGAALLGLLTLGLAVLLASTWPLLGSSQRSGRVLVLLILAGVAVSLLLRR